MKRCIVVLLAPDFEASEYTEPREHLRRAGFEVQVVAAKAGDVLTDKQGQSHITADLGIADASVVNYTGMLIPGGKSPAHLIEDSRFVAFVREFNSSGKPIAAICHGPQLMMAAKLVHGRRLTAVASLHDALKAAGAEVLDQPVVGDKNWVTSRTPADLKVFCEAIVAQFDTNADQSWMARGDVHQAEPTEVVPTKAAEARGGGTPARSQS